MTLHSRGAALLSAAFLLLGGNLLLVPPAAHATTGEMHMCTHDEISNGKVMRAITLRHDTFRMTHAERRRIPAHVHFRREVTLAQVRQLKASFSATVSVKADAGAFFAKASAEASATVGGEGSSTTTSSVTESYDVAPANRSRLFVFYSGNDFFQMRTHRRTCNRSGQDDYYGKLGTFNKISESGAVQCPHTRYKKGSIPYQIALGAGC